VNINIKNKLTASIIHLAISLFFIVLLFIIITQWWYPGQLFIVGALYGMKILVGADLILGPVLTFVVYQKQKKTLKLDLTCIAVIQMLFFLFGSWLIFNERPIAQIINHEGVYLIASSDVNYFNVVIPEVSNDLKPPFFFMDLPSSLSEINAMEVVSEFISEKPLIYRTELFINSNEVSQGRYKERLDLVSSANTIEINSKLHEVSKSKNCDWVPLKSKHITGLACVEYKSGIVALSEYKGFFKSIFSF